MKKKNLTITLLAVAIFSILAISFFIGGNDKVVPLSEEDLEHDVAIIDEVVPTFDNENDRQDSDEVDKVDKSDTLEKETNESEQKDVAEEPVKEAKQEPHSEIEKNTPKETKKESNPEVPKEQPKETPKEQPKEPKKAEKPVEQQSNQDLIEKQKEEKKQIIAEDNANLDKKDKYLTDPVPAGKPKPVEWQDVTIEKDKQLSVSLSVTAKTILNNMHLFNQNKLEVLPADGVIYPKQTVTFYQGESVFDVLLREMKANKIHMEFVMTPIYNSHYIEGINNLYEFDCGELSGWMYKVNGWFPNYGASRYQLQDGDVVDWVYTCDLGRDIGGGNAIGGGQ